VCCRGTFTELKGQAVAQAFSGWVKLNFDGSFKIKDGTAGARMVLQDDDGQVIFSCRHLFKCTDPLEAEARACEEGLTLVLQQSELPIEVESDCLCSISPINGKLRDRSSLAHLTEEIKFLANGDRHISFVKVDRSQNRANYCLANFARTKLRTVFWFG
jgi:ribonuclease HI